MGPSANGNRKTFSLSLYIPPLSRTISNGLPSSKDCAAARSERSLQSYVQSPGSRASFLSPRSPPLPASLHLKQEQPVLPIPLSDGLDPSEKMKLLRKTRKLSRILGEVPIPVSVSSPSPATPEFRFLGVLEEPSLTSASTAASSSPAKLPPPGIEQQGSLRRSATVGHNRHAQQGDIHRARSLATLRPSLAIPPAALTIHTSPISPIVFSWPDKNPIPPSPVSPVEVSEDQGVPESVHSKRDSTVSSKRDSVASSIFPSERSPEQVLRARAAKLARQLGDNIPPEVLLRAASPVSRSPLSSPSALTFAEASLSIHERPRRTSSMRRARDDRESRKVPKRRLSLDIRAFVRISEPPVPSPSLANSERCSTVPPEDKHNLARSKTTGAHPARSYDTDGEETRPNGAPPAAVEQDSDLDLEWEDDLPGARALERQRALNVRRARKMLQVFGNEPPPALFQITNIPPGATDDGISARHRRSDSRATTVSLPATLSAPEAHRDKRNSVATISSSDDLSPLIFAGPGSIPPSQPTTPYPGRSEGNDQVPSLPPLPSQDNVLEVRPASPHPLPTLASSSLHSLSASTISVAASQAQLTKDRGPPSSPTHESFQASPPANQTMFLWSSSVAAPTSPPVASPSVLADPPAGFHPSDPHFRVRRIRAAKLSRFFGVGLNDIAGMLRSGSAPSSPPTLGASGAAGPAMLDEEDAAASPPSSPPLREFRRSSSSASFHSPTSPVGSLNSRSSARPSRPTRPVTSAGIVGAPSVSIMDVPRERKRTLSSGARSQSASHGSRRPQTQPVLQSSPVGERSRSNSQPEVLLQQPQVHNRAFSTTVEVSTESKGPFAFLDGRRPGKAKELNMHDVIRELRKIK
ncbi:hypothetical protein C8Q77DRAFT_1080504 [Trametes polyzona]|nr:hypothetical protein C8Q77DRAFT_1080504 [Trametes polyzona]